jgi:hypothetical protein
VAHRRAGEEVERGIVLHVAVRDHAAVAVARVLAEADVRHEDEVGHGDAQRADAALDDAVVVVRARGELVLLRRDPEEQDGREPEAPHLRRFLDEHVDGAAGDPRQSGQRLVDAFALADEHGVDEVAHVHAGLAHEGAQRARPAEAPEPRDGEGGHAERVRHHPRPT